MLMCRNEDSSARNFPTSAGFCIIFNVCIKEASCLKPPAMSDHLPIFHIRRIYVGKFSSAVTMFFSGVCGAQFIHCNFWMEAKAKR